MRESLFRSAAPHGPRSAGSALSALEAHATGLQRAQRHGRLGHGSLTSHNTPRRIEALRHHREVAASAEASLRGELRGLQALHQALLADTATKVALKSGAATSVSALPSHPPLGPPSHTLP